MIKNNCLRGTLMAFQTILSANLLLDLLQYIQYMFLIALARTLISSIMSDIRLGTLTYPMITLIAIRESPSMMTLDNRFRYLFMFVVYLFLALTLILTHIFLKLVTQNLTFSLNSVYVNRKPDCRRWNGCKPQSVNLLLVVDIAVISFCKQ